MIPKDDQRRVGFERSARGGRILQLEQLFYIACPRRRHRKMLAFVTPTATENEILDAADGGGKGGNNRKPTNESGEAWIGSRLVRGQFVVDLRSVLDRFSFRGSISLG